jgi:hypothetical protein
VASFDGLVCQDAPPGWVRRTIIPHCLGLRQSKNCLWLLGGRGDPCRSEGLHLARFWCPSTVVRTNRGHFGVDALARNNRNWSRVLALNLGTLGQTHCGRKEAGDASRRRSPSSPPPPQAAGRGISVNSSWSSFIGEFTRIEIGHILSSGAGNGRSTSWGSGSIPSHRS